jgi:hypothetical protein
MGGGTAMRRKQVHAHELDGAVELPACASDRGIP